MNTIKNANGKTYYVKAKMEIGFDNVYLLADYGDKEEIAIQAGALPTKYIVARDWNEQWNSWANGKYFLVFGDPSSALEEAIKCFENYVSHILYYNF